MKFAKIAKDTEGKVLEEGDVLVYKNNGDLVHAVIDKIVQRNRDQFPNVQVLNVTSDWRGNNVKVQRSTLTVEAYKVGRVLNASLLRDDVPVNVKVKEVQQSVIAKSPKKMKR